MSYESKSESDMKIVLETKNIFLPSRHLPTGKENIFHTYIWIYFTLCSSVSIVRFEHVFADWVYEPSHLRRNFLASRVYIGEESKSLRFPSALPYGKLVKSMANHYFQHNKVIKLPNKDQKNKVALYSTS